MSRRSDAMAVLHYQRITPLPVVHFGFWDETLAKWSSEGHLDAEDARSWYDGNTADMSISRKLGFDFNWYSCFSGNTGLMPAFESRIIATRPDGSREVLNAEGVIVIEKDGAGSIPMEVGHTLSDRKSWERHYLPRLQDSAQRLDHAQAKRHQEESGSRDLPLALHCGSLYGQIRNWLGIEGISYLAVDDPDLYDEIIDVVGQLELAVMRRALATGISFDFAHFWEDICFKNGPLVNPAVFAAKVGPWYRRITDELGSHGIDIVSLDCDGLIDELIPVWIENGVNTMFPIEVGTWNASIAPWRKLYGRSIRGVGGMNKLCFSRDTSWVVTYHVPTTGFLPMPSGKMSNITASGCTGCSVVNHPSTLS